MNNYNNEEETNEIINPELQERIVKAAATTHTIWNIIKLLPLIIIGLVFFLVASYAIAKNIITSQNCISTVAEFSKYEYVETFDGSYRAYYKYEVDGVEYEIIYDEYKKNYEEFEDTIPIKYNEKDPRKVVFGNRGWIQLLLFGLFFIVFALFCIFGIKFNSSRIKNKIISND